MTGSLTTHAAFDIDLGAPESKTDKRKRFFSNLKNNAPAILKGITGGMIGSYALKSVGLGVFSAGAMVYAKPLYSSFNKSASAKENLQSFKQVFQDKSLHKDAIKAVGVSALTMGLIENADTLKVSRHISHLKA